MQVGGQGGNCFCGKRKYEKHQKQTKFFVFFFVFFFFDLKLRGENFPPLKALKKKHCLR